MKLVFFLLLSVNITFSQACLEKKDTKMSLYFKNGDVKKGYAFRKKQVIKFRENKNNKYEKYKLGELDSILTGSKNKVFHIIVNGKKTFNARELYLRGRINIYVSSTSSGSSYGTFAFTNYYLKRLEEPKVTYLGGGNYWDSFKRDAKKYFDDCPVLVEKIKNNEKGFKKKDLINIVKYYNTKCN